MRKIIVVLAILPLLFAFAGCPTEDKTESMTFEKEDGSKIFTISDDLKFKAVFVNEESDFSLGAGDYVSGTITIEEGKWNEGFDGVAKKMTSNSPNLVGILGPLEVPIIMKYKDKDGNVTTEKGTIAMVNIEFKHPMYGDVAQALMGGDYNLQK